MNILASDIFFDYFLLYWTLQFFKIHMYKKRFITLNRKTYIASCDNIRLLNKKKKSNFLYDYTAL